MSSIKVAQSHIEAAGDVAGGDIDKSTHIIHHPKPGPLAGTIAKYHEELRSGSSINQIIDKLQHWHDSDTSAEILGVEEKLKLGNRGDLVTFGIRAKELFAKCLLRHQQSKAAQEIFAYLLGTIWQKFNQIVLPRISEGKSNQEIDKLIQEEIIYKVEEILESNPLGIDPSEISGMMFFLTGNCHLNWK